ncbi:MAG: phosphoserine aminotransferase [Spirochaetes bacterium]|nr:MAG: phosphoserine aminotransferase [Spirochaetota bacterium]
MKRVINFNAGPAGIPVEVLEQARDEMLDWNNTGMSVMEVSHRSKEYEAMHDETQERFKALAGMGPEWKVLFLTGGASSQFFQVPMNFLFDGRKATYLVTGTWGKKALEEAKRFGPCDAISSKNPDGTFTRVLRQDEISVDPSSAYVHMTSNNTLFGSQWHYWPEVGSSPLVCDMSSDIFSRPFPVDKFSFIYAGAQKNLGPSGLTVVAARQDFLEKSQESAKLPTMLSYATHLENNSLYNTPPCFSIYMLSLTLKWLEKRGGLAAMAQVNEEKGKIVYGAIDASQGFYRCPVQKDSRSLMNVVFRLGSEELEELFVKEAKAAGIIGVKGHRSTGGIRFSMYNANLAASAHAAAAFMDDFRRRHG